MKLLFIIGAGASLFSAASWALGTVLFFKFSNRVTPFGLNLCRGMVGLFFLGLPMCFAGRPSCDLHSFFILGLSGLLGIAIGDTFYFKTLLNLGPRLTSLIGIIVPVIAALCAMLVLKECPNGLVWTGIILTAAGTGWVLWEKSPSQGTVIINKAAGIIYGLLCVAASTAAAVLSKIGIQTVSPLTATFIRIFWGVMGLLVWGALNRQIKKDLLPFKDFVLFKNFVFIVMIGVYGGFWLFLVSIKYIDLATAISLNSTSALFVLPMAVIITKEAVSWRAVAGATAAVLGIMLVMSQAFLIK